MCSVLHYFCTVTLQFTSDSDAEVRDAACGAIGSMMRLTGEKVMNTFIGNLQEDKTKMKKVSGDNVILFIF